MENEMDSVCNTLRGENTSARRVVMGRNEANRPLVPNFKGEVEGYQNAY